MKKDEIIARYLGGETVINLAKEYKLTRERIYQYLRQVPDFKEISRQKRREKTLRRLRTYYHLLPEISERRDKGQSITRIARELEVPYSTLKALVKGTPWDNSEKARAKRNKAINRAYIRGLSQVKIAKKFHVCQSLVSVILLRLNNGRLPKRLRKRD